jgi:transcription elongation factor GreA
MATDAVWMTEAARARLEDEVAELERRAAAGEQTDAARALQLRTLLRSAQVGRMPDDGLVEPGMVVTVRFAADGSETTFLLGSRDLAALDPDLEMDLYSPTSPLGGAITGRYVGDTVSYTAPSGAQEITIASAVPFG